MSAFDHRCLNQPVTWIILFKSNIHSLISNNSCSRLGLKYSWKIRNILDNQPSIILVKWTFATSDVRRFQIVKKIINIVSTIYYVFQSNWPFYSKHQLTSRNLTGFFFYNHLIVYNNKKLVRIFSDFIKTEKFPRCISITDYWIIPIYFFKFLYTNMNNVY